MKSFLALLLCFSFLQADENLLKEISTEVLTLQKQLEVQDADQTTQRKTLLQQMTALEESNNQLQKEIEDWQQKKNVLLEKTKQAEAGLSDKTVKGAERSIDSLSRSLKPYLTKALSDEKDLKLSWANYVKAFRQAWATGLGVRVVDGYATDTEQGGDLEGKLIHLSRHSQLFVNDQKSGILRKSKGEEHYYLEALADSENHQALQQVVQGQEATVQVDITRGAAFKLLRVKRSLWQEIQKGGTTAYPLMALAILCMLVFLYKLIQLALLPKVKGSDLRALLDCIDHSDELKANELLKKSKGPMAELMQHIWQHRKASREQMEEFVSEALLGIVPKLRRLLSILSVSAAAAPLLGLLGTVMGIIATFDLISVFGTGDASRLGEGISEALITTKLGLLVAIPALIAHAFLNRWVKGFIADLERNCLSFLNLYETKDDAQ